MQGKIRLDYCVSLKFDLGMTGMNDSWLVYLQGLIWRLLVFKLASFWILVPWWERSCGRGGWNLDDM